MEYVKLILVCFACYLLGCINFGKIVSKVFRNDDITKHGSGNPGSSNILRTYGFRLFLITFLLDALKGLGSALLGFFLFGASFYNEWAVIAMYACGLSCVLGHVFPIISGFHGGKGMATAIGVFAVANFPLLILFALIGFGIFLKCKYMSILTLTIVVGTGVCELLIKNIFFCPSLVMSGLLLLMICVCVFAHRSNFVRLAQGRENKVNFSRWFGKKNK